MLKQSEHHVYFAIFGSGDDPAVVTQAMRVEPTKAWIKGEPTGTGQGIQTHSRWVLQSKLPLTESIEAHFENLLPQLESRRQVIADLRTRFEARLTVVASWREVNPGFCLSSSIIQRVAALGLEVEFDAYCLGDSNNAS